MHKGYPVPLAVAAGLGVGTFGGLLNGLIVTRLKIPSLITTLGTAAIANGCAFWATEGVAFVGRWPTEFTALARGSVFGIPAPILWVAAAALIAQFLLKQTPLGLHMTATGDADEAARLAGISTARMKLIGMTLSGLAAGICAVLLAANLSSAAPNMAGDYLLQAIAAVLLGMTMFEPGHANVPGALVGAAILSILNNGLVLIGAPYFMQDILLGCTIVAAVALPRPRRAQACRLCGVGRDIMEKQTDQGFRGGARHAGKPFAGQASAFDLGIVAFQMSSETHARVANAARDAGAAKGWDVQILNSEGSLPKHAQQLDDLIQRKVDAIIVAMGKPVEAEAQLKAAADAKIPVITVMSGTSAHTLFDVQVNEYKVGAEAAPLSARPAQLSGQHSGAATLRRQRRHAHPRQGAPMRCCPKTPA